jgi:hypothetical protein
VVIVKIGREHQHVDQARLDRHSGDIHVVIAEADGTDTTIVPVPIQPFNPLHRPVLPQ